MAEQTEISWAHSTFNPWIGCTNVSPGCDHCYAEALALVDVKVLDHFIVAPGAILSFAERGLM